MSIKSQRLSAIENIIRTEKISCQDDLQKSLTAKGFDVAQATLSRDIKQLKIAKVHDGINSYFYRLDSSGQNDSIDTSSLQDVHSIEFSGNLAVLKTPPGYAMAIAYDIDTKKSDEILGTIAGDDTILIIPRNGYSTEEIQRVLISVLKKKE
jgi:transcriptional regulator of arginine metabolism